MPTPTTTAPTHRPRTHTRSRAPLQSGLGFCRRLKPVSVTKGELVSEPRDPLINVCVEVLWNCLEHSQTMLEVGGPADGRSDLIERRRKVSWLVGRLKGGYLVGSWTVGSHRCCRSVSQSVSQSVRRSIGESVSIHESATHSVVGGKKK